MENRVVINSHKSDSDSAHEIPASPSTSNDIDDAPRVFSITGKDLNTGIGKLPTCRERNTTTNNQGCEKPAGISSNHVITNHQNNMDDVTHERINVYDDDSTIEHCLSQDDGIEHKNQRQNFEYTQHESRHVFDQAPLRPMNMHSLHFPPSNFSVDNCHPHFHHPSTSFYPNFPCALPTIPSLPIPPSCFSHGSIGPNLNATRQYYEAQMREHAMHYANAAAGAAWVAARIAYGECEYSGMSRRESGAFNMSTPASPCHYTPAFTASGMSFGWDQVDPTEGPASYQRQGKLWKPSDPLKNSETKRNLKKEKLNHSAQTGSQANTKGSAHNTAKATVSEAHATQNDKKRPKKSESGNDSVSSMGSGSLDQTGSNPVSRKVSQRRRINEDSTIPEESVFTNLRSIGESVNKIHNYKKSIQRNKRGLHQSHSAMSNVRTTHCSASTSHHDNFTGKNKRRTTETPIQLCDSALSSQVFLGGLIGKSGISALHELCSKYRWEMPKYAVIEPSHLASKNDIDGTNNNNGSNCNMNEFILSVRVNGVELGRGRGGTKASSKQDASRKALSVLVPGVVFDPNGILLDVGSGLGYVLDKKSLSEPTSLDDLGPHLASQLAIGGKEMANHSILNDVGVRTRPSSPDFSEDSSISTTVSMTRSAVGCNNESRRVVCGGPLHSKNGDVLMPHNLASYPSASSTSEIDEDDENAYYASRGASVCSTLLHAIWQIDDRIRDPPSYTFDLLHKSPIGVSTDLSLNDKVSDISSSKRKAVTPIEVPAHRAPFQCTASLTLHFLNRCHDDKESFNLMDYWQSPLEHLSIPPHRRKESILSKSCRKRTDTLLTQVTPTPIEQHTFQAEDNDDTAPLNDFLEKADSVTHQLKVVATGSTKRESKHRASAKMLAILFPECSSMVEVKAAAEAARECYAANKNSTHTKLSKHQKCLSCFNVEAPFHKDDMTKPDLIVENSVEISIEKKIISSDQQSHGEDPATESFVSVAGLSLSEHSNESKRVKWCDAEEMMQNQEIFENEIDSALRSLDGEEDLREDTDFSLSDAGKFLLRRATIHDFDFIRSFLNKESSLNTCTDFPSSSQSSNLNESAISQNFQTADDEDSLHDENNIFPDFFSLLHGGITIILLLTRATTSQYEPPLGLSILSLKYPSEESKERLLTLCDLRHEEHLPRERFMDCLDVFAKKIHCDLNICCLPGNDQWNVSPAEIITFVEGYLSSEKLNGARASNKDEYLHYDKCPRSHLQSVQEEDSEEADGSEDDDGKDLVGRKRSRVI